MADVVPPACLTYLPFSPEAVDGWQPDGDLGRFLVALYDMPGTLIAPDGTKHEINYSDYGTYRFTEGLPGMKLLAEELTELSSLRGAEDVARSKHAFAADPRFGRAAKAIVAYDAMTSALLSESCFVSPHHTLEAQTDLECSILLMKTFYYKQAGYCLRAFVENSILPLYFAFAPEDYRLWKAGQFKFQALRGKKGMLAAMVGAGRISSPLADATDAVVEKLNGFVHSGADRMIHAGHETGNWRGLSFKLDAVHLWCDLLSEGVEVGLRFSQLQAAAWQKIRREKPNMCPMCHVEDYTKEEVRDNFGLHYVYTCRQCGDIWRRSG